MLGIARRGTPTEQGAAMMALGNTQSVGAVRALIDLIASPDMAYPLDAHGSLFVLTHHQLEPVNPRRTTAQTFAAWQQWWDAGGKDARVYSPFECVG